VLRLIPFACMPSLIPRQVRWKLIRSYLSIVFGLPRIGGGSAPALSVDLLSVYSRYGLHAHRVAYATLYTEGFSSFVASAAASIATEWSEPVSGRDFSPAVDQRLFTAHSDYATTRALRREGRYVE
jgi:hypothetical protein